MIVLKIYFDKYKIYIKFYYDEAIVGFFIGPPPWSNFVISVEKLNTTPTSIRIGVLVDLSGPLATYGNDIKNTLEIAKEDINAYFKEKGLSYKVEFYVEDTRVDPKIALDKVQALYGRGY